MNTLPADDWLALCRRQTARAMAGDHRAAAWCAKHAPAVDAACLWAFCQRLQRAYDRLHLLWRGTDKLATGRWQEGCPEYAAWAEEVRQAFTTPEAQADLDATLARSEDWTPDEQGDFLESLQDLLELLAEARGLNPAAMTPEQGEAFARAVAEGDGLGGVDAFAERLKAEHPGVCLIAGKQQAGGAHGHAD